MTSRAVVGITTQDQVQPTTIDMIEMGVPADLPFSGGFGSMANELLDRSEVTVETLRKMYRRDGHVRSIYRILSLPIRTLNPTFNAREGESSDGEEEAEFVTNAFTKPPNQGGMSSSFGRFLTTMTKALADGFVVFEKVWQIDEEGQATYRKFAPRDAQTVSFLLDETGGLAGIRQRVQWQGRYRDIQIPVGKLLVYTAQHEENPWYGESYLLPAYYHWDQKTKLKYVANLATQFHAVPGRIGTFPEGTDKPQRDGFRRALASFGFNTAMTKPANFTVEEFGGKGTIPDFKAMFDYEDTQSAKSVLAQFMQLGTGSNTGSWALSGDQSDLFTMALQAVADEMAEAISFYAIPQLVDYNFGSSAYPECQLGPLSDEAKAMMADVFKEISDATSLNVTPEFMFEIEAKVAEALDLKIDYEKMREEMRLRAEEEKELALRAQEALIEGMRNPAPPQGPQGDDGDGAEGQPPTTIAASEVMTLFEALRRRRRR